MKMKMTNDNINVILMCNENIFIIKYNIINY